MHPAFEEGARWGNIESSVKAVNAEYETEIHFQKCYGVMSELFEAHSDLHALLPMSFRFLDLGCAPGGFSSFLLEDPRCQLGFGVTLPSSSGGFPVRVRSNKFFLQQADLFEIGPADLIASDVHVCVCDAQYLRNNISWDEKYRGVRCRSKQHGVWAILLKQFWLGLSRLLAGGILIFRFGWRDPGPEDPATIWYKKMTLRLFSLLIDLFGQVREVKSDYFNALQSSFYVCCSNFKKERFVEREVAKLLGVSFNYLLSTEVEDSNELDILPQADRLRTEEVDKRISEMLDRVQKIRLVHEQSRKWHHKQEVTREDPRAVIVLAPVPAAMTDAELTSTLAVYGRVVRIHREGQQVSVQFAMLEHARSAVTTLRSSGALGDGMGIWIREEEMVASANDAWSADWATVGATERPAPQNDGSKAVPGCAPTKAPASSPPSFAPQPRGAHGGRHEAAAAAAAPGTDAAPRAGSEARVAAPVQAGPPPAVEVDRPAAPAPAQAAARPPAAKAAAARRPAKASTPTQPAKKSTAAGPSKATGDTAPCKPNLHPVVQDKQAAGDAAQCKPSLHPVLQDKQARTRELIAELLKSK